MHPLIISKQKLVMAVINFKDKCATFEQNGVFTTGISESLKFALTNEQIGLVIEHLKQIQNEKAKTIG